MRNIIIVDGHNFFLQAYYGVPAHRYMRDGVRLNAVFGFFSILRHVMSKFPGNRLFVVFDSDTGKDDKLKLYPQYKAGRHTDEDAFEQLPYVKQILDLMNVRWIEHPKYEADDVIASLASYWAGHMGRAYVLSNDFDFVQLISDEIQLLRLTGGQIMHFGHGRVMEKFGVTPNQYLDYRTLVGDKSDNIPGVMGVYRDVAIELLGAYQTLDNIYNNIDDLPGPIRQSLLFNKAVILARRKFITMNREIPITQIVPERIPKTVARRVYKNVPFYLRQIGL